ncbi:phage antirepressor N-terminal domain-containing protein [Streptomyces sp. NBRC 109706]|uniref:phage antirepressor N-terminal domain-containing protein n=1 Tax=Streptomyces sp. NBRC 109706 TaxID=1550035 RepID=UPI000784AADD|nr:phage antirepressor N-terminal domain-containing protein [Streptomyces sp. NBRC 109706]
MTNHTHRASTVTPYPTHGATPPRTTPTGATQPDAVTVINLSAGALHSVLVDGQPHIVLKPAIEALGLDYRTQLRKLKTRTWAVVGERPTTGADGKTYDMKVTPVRTFLMLLATINENNVAENVRPTLVAFQNETADAIEAYWTQGGAINPRATADQLDTIIGRAKAQAEVLRVLDGIVDPAWLDAKARHVAARALGEEPEVDPGRRPLTVGEYLEDKGVTGEALRSLSTTFGKRLKRAFRQRYGTDPGRTERFVSGALREVAAYTEQHRPLFDTVWSEVAR